MSSIELTQGLIVAKRFRLERELGHGGMGTVWQAIQEVTGERFALKFIRPKRGSVDKNAVKRFRREARAPGIVRHPNIVRVHDIFDLDDDLPVMVMELLEGETLGQKLTREKKLALPEAAHILCPVLSAVAAIHSARIVHRDLKPDNIFLSVTPQGTIVPKVLDFGVAKLDARHCLAGDTATLTTDSTMLGTPYYWAWEQISGDTDIDYRADIWAMGSVIYECLAGCRPIAGEDFRQIFKALYESSIVPLDRLTTGLPSEVYDLAARMLTKEREQRVQDLQEAIEVLEKYAGHPISVPPPWPGGRHARYRVLTAACVVVAAGDTSTVYLRRHDASKAAPPASIAASSPLTPRPMLPLRAFDNGEFAMGTGAGSSEVPVQASRNSSANEPQPAPSAAAESGKGHTDNRRATIAPTKARSVPSAIASPAPNVSATPSTIAGGIERFDGVVVTEPTKPGWSQNRGSKR